MAQYDVTSTVTQILALGGTEAEVEQAGDRIGACGDRWIAYNRSSECAITNLLSLKKAATKPLAGRAATPRQIDYIRALGGNPRDDLTLTDASGTIETLKAQRTGARYDVAGEVWDN